MKKSFDLVDVMSKEYETNPKRFGFICLVLGVGFFWFGVFLFIYSV